MVSAYVSALARAPSRIASRHGREGRDIGGEGSEFSDPALSRAGHTLTHESDGRVGNFLGLWRDSAKPLPIVSGLKRFFLSRLFREKVLLLAFVGIGAAIWLSSFSSRGIAAWSSYRQRQTELDTQQKWLTSREQIERAATEAITHLDAKATLNPTQLISELSELARKYSLGFVSDVPQTEKSGAFSLNTVTVTIRTPGKNGDAEFNNLELFCRDIAAKAPYMAIQQLNVVASRSNGAQLSMVLRVVSVELTRE